MAHHEARASRHARILGGSWAVLGSATLIGLASGKSHNDFFASLFGVAALVNGISGLWKRRLFGVLTIFLSSVVLFGGVVLLSAAISALSSGAIPGVRRGAPIAAVVGSILALLGVYSLAVVGVPAFVSGIEGLCRRRFSRVLAIVASLVLLVGTGPLLPMAIGRLRLSPNPVGWSAAAMVVALDSLLILVALYTLSAATLYTRRPSGQAPDTTRSAAQEFRPVTDSTRRYEYVGFSVQPPPGGHWFPGLGTAAALARDSKMDWNVTFEISPSPGAARPRSFVDRLRQAVKPDPTTVFAAVRSGFIDVPAETGSDLLERLAPEKKETKPGDRFHLLEFRTSWDSSFGADCLRYESTMEDRGVPGYRGAVFVTSEYGVLCAHPDCRWFVIDAEYSRRILRGVPAADFHQEAESFLQSLKFSRLERPLIAAVIPVGTNPTAVAMGEDAVWVANIVDNTVSRIDPETNEVVATVPVGRNPGGIALNDDAVWVTNFAGATVSRIDAKTNRVVATVPVSKAPLAAAADSDAVWLTHDAGGSVSRIDVKTNRVVATTKAGRKLRGIAVGAGFVWVASERNLIRIDPHTSRVVGRPIVVGKDTGDVAVGEGSVWITDPVASGVARVDPATCRVVATIPVAGPPLRLTVGGGALWTTNLRNRTISKIDPQTNRVVGTALAAGRPLGIAIGKDAVWVGNRAGNTVQRLAL
jgi:virginiamycin B lyase